MSIFPPVDGAHGASKNEHDIDMTAQSRRTGGTDDSSYLKHDMSSAATVSQANDRAARAGILAKKEGQRASRANEARHQMANRMIGANKQLAVEAQEVAKLRAAVDWTSGAQRTAAEASLRQKIELLDRAERERDMAQTKMKAAESRAALALQTAKKEERERVKWEAQFKELSGSKGGALEDVAKLERQLQREQEKFSRLERENDALLEGAGALQEQIAAERAKMAEQFEQLNKERDVMIEERKRDASDKKEKERLQVLCDQLEKELQESSELWPKLQFTEQQLAATRTQLGNAQEERDECVASETAMRNKLAEEKRIHESTTKKLELTREKVENLTLDLEQTREGWDDFKKETRLLQRQVEKEWESKELQAQALFMSRVAKMEADCTARVQRHMDESKHLHEALDLCRGDLRRVEAEATDWKVKATGSFADTEQLEVELARLKAKLVSMEEAAQRKQAEIIEVEAVAAQVNPLKERVARLRQDVRERDELIVRLKADALLREQKIVELNHVINDWKCKVGAKQEAIDDRDKQLVILQAALVDKYEDIRSQIFTAEQMARYKAYEVARLQNVLVYRGMTDDVYCQTEMPGEDAGTQCNFPKLPRLPFIQGDEVVVVETEVLQLEDGANNQITAGPARVSKGV